jgi:VWFA-related protein
MTRSGFRFRLLSACAAAALALLAQGAQAAVEIRVQSRPLDEPIKAFIHVTSTSGVPVGSLAADDFTATIDSAAQAGVQFTQPAIGDPAQRLSVIFAIDYSSSVQDFFVDAIQAGVATFIDNMRSGDYAGIIKFNDTNGATLVQPFTQIDGGNGESLLITALQADYDGIGTNLIDAIDLAAETFAGANFLPNGPKAVILISDGDDNSSELSLGDVIPNANAAGIAVFTVSVGDISGDVAATALMSALAADTGGRYFAGPDEAEIEAAYDTVSSHLNNSYVLTFPPTAATACDHEYALEIAVEGQPEPGTLSFTRCDATPDDFHFVNQTGVDPGSVVTSNTVSITGIDSPVGIAVSGGEYSVGCGSSFTTAAGTLLFEDEVCVRHSAADDFSTSTGPTVLVVGGVSSSFTSTTHAEPPPNPRGGGGAAGLLELLLALSAALAIRRRG